MKHLNIYLNTNAFYVRLAEPSDFKKYNSRLAIFEFLEFEDINYEHSGIINGLSLRGVKYFCDNPFERPHYVGASRFEPDKTVVNSENDFYLIFSQEQSKKLKNNKYKTSENKHHIVKVSFKVEKVTLNLYEKIEYSDGDTRSSWYYLIPRTVGLEKPSHYFTLDDSDKFDDFPF